MGIIFLTTTAEAILKVLIICISLAGSLAMDTLFAGRCIRPKST